MSSERPCYPELRAENLLGEKRAYPSWFEGRRTLVLVVWTHEQQPDAQTWLSLAGEVPVVVQPVVAPWWRVVKALMDRWLQAWAEDDEARERTVPLFVPAEELAQALGVDDRSAVTVLLVDERGGIAGRWSGPADAERLEAVRTEAEAR